ncbi:MAG TPA: hypothetical protein VGQ57_05685, partial [Polyangiaceae bacterium]|nr:hypothetical protein [Polyangiaceae bacterium]
PGQALVTTSSSSRFDQPTSFTVHGALPHMHTLGKTLHAEVEAGQSQCLVDVDRWDFHWQNAWWYDQPIHVTDATELRITCGYDTRSRTDTVHWGDSTSDEMCISYFYVTTSDAPDPVISCSDDQNPLFGSCLDTALDGCFTPDLTGECHNDGTELTWSDGSKLDITGAAPGFYGPGDKKPCVTLDIANGSVSLSRDGNTLSYAQNKDGVAFTCPDRSVVQATNFQFQEFGACRGLSCPQ